MDINLEKIEAAVVAEVTDSVLTESGIAAKLDKLLQERVDALFAATAERRVSEIIERAVQEGFDHEYLKLDSFGRQVGESTTIRKELEKSVRDYWSTPVDSQGKPEKRDSWGDKTTRAQWVMVQVCGKDFAETLKAQMVNVTAGLKEGLRAEMRKWIDTSLGELFHVRTEQDKAEGRYK